MNKKLLPQANDLQKVYKVFIFAGMKENCTKEEIADFCQFTLRQSDYYLGANIYLGLLDGECKLTDQGRRILSEENRADSKRLFYESVISDPLVSRFLAHLLLFPELSIEEHQHYAAEVTREGYSYSDAVIERRSSAMLGWCVEILQYIKENPLF